MQGEREDEERRDGRGDAAEQQRDEGVRVTDRRRVRVDFDDEGGAGREEAGGERGQVKADDAPSLKPKYVEELEARTRAAEQKAADVQARFEQVRAQLQRETDEVRQRLNRNADERAAREKAAFITSLLPVVDNLRRAIEAAEAGGEVSALLDGLRGTVSGFESALAGAGVESVAAVGEQFNPEMHEAVDTVEVEPARDGEVTAEYTRGYRIGNQLLRPARVQVGRARGEAQAAS